MKVVRIIEGAGDRLLLALCLGSMLIAPVIVSAQRTARRNNQPVTTQSEQAISELREAASLLESGRAAEAEPLLRRVLLASPNNSDAHNLLGIVLDQAGKTAEAEREYRAAIRLNPSGVSALANLGVLFARTSRA